MRKINQGPNQHFNPYYEDSALLIQFILTEFVHTHRLTLQIKMMIDHYLASKIRTTDPNTTLVMLLSQLVGSTSLCSPLTSFSSWTKGSLTKLKEYCELLSRHSCNPKKNPMLLHKAVHQTWLIALNQLELLQVFQAMMMQSRKALSTTQINRVKKLQMQFELVIKQIPLMVHPYWDNENVILCLLRHKEPLKHIYGEVLFYQLFKWPLNSIEIKKMIEQRYLKRGFKALCPLIDQQFSSIEASHDARP